MKEQKYLHGYDEKEQERLHRQAAILAKMTYENLNFEGITTMLEMGCGTGGQTEILLEINPSLQIISVDIAESQIEKAKQNLAHLATKTNFIQGDITALSFPDNSFDAVFICWVLEHTPQPLAVLKEAFRLLKPKGKIYITEVHNESLKLFPAKKNIETYMEIFNNFQFELGGDPNIGLKLGTMAHKVGFKNVKKQSLSQHHDHSDFLAKKTIVTYFKNLFLSAAGALLAAQKIDENLLEKMQQDFDDLIEDENGVYYYSPIQLVAEK